ncbi:MAG: imidazole glycerol phosphate synthase subunit HisH [Nitriliruptorales bacterium]|nr:imidazole glycerol phosphate synthase subunit HisH [Nitriliruptorales bacterium]
MTPARIAVLDYDAGNLRSAAKALTRAGADVTVTADAAEASRADALVVPGVGHFGQCVRRFRAAGLEALAQDWVAADRPLLGICVGMQILYAASEEEPVTRGLGVLPGQVRRLPDDVTVPHMGWNVVTPVRPDPLLKGIGGQRCYFVHSYYAAPSDDAHVLATCDYGPGFPCVVRVGHTVGTQFHPEKSAAVGGRLLTNFVSAVASRSVGVGSP